MKPILTAESISVRYGDRTVVDVSRLDLFPGDVLAVIGPNGSGKSTLLRVLAALEAPTTGRLLFHGHPVDWRRSLAYRRRIAVVLQDPLLLDRKVFSNVAMGWYLRGERGNQISARVVEWLEKFHVAHLRNAPARHLSGGEARRVALARAFVLEPEILFLDEPFSSLDVPTREEILMDLRQVLDSSDTTALLVTHDRDEALALADRVVVLLEGRIRQVGPPGDVFSHPADLAVAEFVGVENILPARVTGRAGKGTLLKVAEAFHLRTERDFPLGADVHACIRPEHVHLAPAPLGSRRPGEEWYRARVIKVYPLGSRVKVRVQVGEVVLSSLIEYPRWTEMAVREGDPVWVHVPPCHVHVIGNSNRQRVE